MARGCSCKTLVSIRSPAVGIGIAPQQAYMLHRNIAIEAKQ
jgi:hypothetical protein